MDHRPSRVSEKGVFNAHDRLLRFDVRVPAFVIAIKQRIPAMVLYACVCQILHLVEGREGYAVRVGLGLTYIQRSASLPFLNMGAPFAFSHSTISQCPAQHAIVKVPNCHCGNH